MQSLDRLSLPADFVLFLILLVYHWVVTFLFSSFYLFSFFFFFNADIDVPPADSDSILSTTLMEARDQEGLNYLVVVKESNQDQGSISSAELTSV